MTDAIGNSFPIIVLPIYIGTAAFAGGAFGLNEALITGIVISAFGFVNSSANRSPGGSRIGRVAAVRSYYSDWDYWQGRTSRTRR